MPQLIQIREAFLASSRQYLADAEAKSLHCGSIHDKHTCPSSDTLTTQGTAGD